jgi:hypothetical protein
MQLGGEGVSPKGQRGNGGWVRAGLAVLVTGVLGGGVVTVARDTSGPRKVTADGTTRAAGSPAGEAAAKPVDFATPSPPAEQAPKADPAIGDKIPVGSDGGSVTVAAVEDDVSAGRLFGAGKGFKYLAAEVKGCSGPHEKNLTFQPNYFMLRLDDGTMRDHGPGAKKPELTGGTVQAGKCLSGWVTFTVPSGALATAVLYDGSSRLTWTVPLPKGAKPTTSTTGKAGVTTTSSPGDDTTPTTSGKATTATTGKATTTTTGRTGTAAKAGAATTTTSRASTTTTTSRSTTTTSKSSPSTTAPPGTTTTTGPKATTSTTSGSVATTPTAPTG